jgi:hypothetical protein
LHAWSGWAVFRKPASCFRSEPASVSFSLEELAEMRAPDPEASRAESITAALIYLMTHYARTGCPRLALCVSRHMQCLAVHPDAVPIVRDVCASLHGAWATAAAPGEVDASQIH